MLCRLLLGIFVINAATAGHAETDIQKAVSDDMDRLVSLYHHLHQNPELSFREVESSKRMAAALRENGFEVTEAVGRTGVVGVLENGAGPTVLVRADMDALPVVEQTGVPYASTVKAINDKGDEVGVMHACGHDVHMTVFAGVARLLSEFRDQWSGTLVMIAQPAEEIGGGAKAMLGDGLFERFPRPDYNLAIHVSASQPAGVIEYVPNYAMANVDSVDITVFGIGGHGAYPHLTKDPVVLSAQIINSLQTLVSREISPIEAGVVTVGSIHGGAKHNVIPDEVKLQLTVRTYSDAVRDTLLQGIERVAVNQARVMGFPDDKLPLVEVKDEYTPSLYNNPELTERLSKVFEQRFGSDRVVEGIPVMGGEDFGRYGREEPLIPSLLFRVGAVDPEKYAAANEKGEKLPSLHSPFFAPLPEPTISTGVEAMSLAVLDLLGK